MSGPTSHATVDTDGQLDGTPVTTAPYLPSASTAPGASRPESTPTTRLPGRGANTSRNRTNRKKHPMKICSPARSIIAAAAFAAVALLGSAAPASADTTCTSDTCVVNNDTQTPAGVVTVTATADNVVTVHLTPTATNTIVFGVPFAYPPGPPTFPGYTRTSIATASAGTVNIDTILFPPGPPTAPSLPTIVIISIHPPGPCRSRTVGTTVTFTPTNVHR